MKCFGRIKGCCGPVPLRYVTIIMGAFGLAIMFTLRNSFSLVMTRMVIKNKTEHNSTKDVGIYCPKPKDVIEEYQKMPGEFDWAGHKTQYLISGYFFGYVLAHVPGGIIGDILGAKVVLNTGLLLGGICAVLTPVCARLNFWLLFFVRSIMGLGHGVVFPSLSALVAMWAIPNERALMSAITMSGIQWGSAAGISFTGLILGKIPGWEPPFYIFGGVMLVWNAIFFIVGYSSPAKHPFITEEEATTINEAITKMAPRKKPSAIPWRRILLSPPVLSLILIMTAHSWIIFFIGVQLPLYVKTILHFDIIGSGISAALPYLGMWSTGMFTGAVSDWIVRHKYLTITTTRRTCALLSSFLPVPFFLGASYAGCDRVVVTALFTLTMFFKGLAYASVMANCVDLSPNFAGLLMGLANGGSAVGGLMIPYVVNWFIADELEASLSDWRKVFFFSAGILVLLSLPFAFFGSGEEQPWNTEGMDEEERT